MKVRHLPLEVVEKIYGRTRLAFALYQVGKGSTSYARVISNAIFHDEVRGVE